MVGWTVGLDGGALGRDGYEREFAGRMTAGDFFLAEWRARRAGQGRSLRRARDLADALGIREDLPPLLSVVGSKGKGTTATYASACLAAAGIKVVTVTGPGYRRSNERIRLCGRAISDTALNALAGRLADAVRTLPGRHDGYLAPTGLFTIAGVLHARAVEAGAIVLEAGMGGGSDEISLFSPDVAALAPIFAEHVGKLGNTPAEIAREKAAIVTPRTRAVLTAPQTHDVQAAIDGTVRERGRDGLSPDVVRPGTAPVPPGLLPPGLSAGNAELGCAAALRLLDVMGVAPPPAARLATVLGSVRLPGRLSRHVLPDAPVQLIVDAASNRAAVTAALAAARNWWPAIDHALVSLPDHKDVAGAIGELSGLPVTFVRMPEEHLRFTHPLPRHWRVIEAAEMTRDLMAGLGERIIALGTVYFAGMVLDLAEADTECLFLPGPPLSMDA